MSGLPGKCEMAGHEPRSATRSIRCVRRGWFGSSSGSRFRDRLGQSRLHENHFASTRASRAYAARWPFPGRRR